MKRQAKISIGWSSTFVGDVDTITKIADLLDSSTMIDTKYASEEDGGNYHYKVTDRKGYRLEFFEGDIQSSRYHEWREKGKP